MSKIKKMIESAPTKKMVKEMLESMRIFGNVSEIQYKQGLDMIKEEFEK
jgi:hypothetical protein